MTLHAEAAALVAEAMAVLTAAGQPPLDDGGVVLEPVADLTDCECDGRIFVVLEDVLLNRANRCVVTRTTRWELHIFRTVETLGDHGQLPTLATQQDEALIAYADAEALMADLDGVVEVEPIAPEGGSAGVQITVERST
ncbi:MAG: hypothetical protein AAFZ07_19550 [Actinomycetota bacterium]